MRVIPSGTVGSGSSPFPPTQLSAVIGLKSADGGERERSLERVLVAYWRPVYAYLRLRWRKSPEDAEDTTQSFFLRAIDQGTFGAYDPQRSKFRTFLRVCLDRFAIQNRRADRAEKRGGHARQIPLDFASAETSIDARGEAQIDPEQLFEREWTRHTMARAAEILRQECTEKRRLEHFRAFERFYLLEADGAGPPSYAAIADALGISVTDVTNRLKYARREYRRIVLTLLRDAAGSDEELEDDARSVLGGAT